jgi:ABC-type transport system involved in multi-copper enzyme maturation permease subunit
MNVLPVVERELRVQARKTFTYFLRVLGVATLLLICFYFITNHDLSQQMGGRLFGLINLTLFISIWVVVPSLAADAISHEKREGTLGLLFLTPLQARDIVLAKGMVHGLRAFSLWLAVLPVMTIPLLLGGVTWREGVISACVNFGSICWALAAGVIATSTGKSWVRCSLMAYCFALLFFTLFGYLNGLAIFTLLGNYMPAWGYIDVQRVLPFGIYYATDYSGIWGQVLASITAAERTEWLLREGIVAIVSFLGLLACIAIAGFPLRRGWQEKPPSPKQVWVEHTFCKPVVGVSFLKRWMRRKLERNPIGWLEQRTWSGRLVTWGWFSIMISVYSFALPGGYNRSFYIIQHFMAWLLVLGISVSAAGSFRRERETGVLELLLVSPITETQVIQGRLRGLWGQFLPALIVLLTIWMYFNTLFRGASDLASILFYGIGFFTLPVIGLYYSLSKGNFFTSLLFTFFMGFALPVGVQVGFSILLSYFARMTMDDLMFAGPMFVVFRLVEMKAFINLWQIVIAIWLGRKLYRNLASRNFALEKPVS